jgi:hypothetical protein
MNGCTATVSLVPDDRWHPAVPFNAFSGCLRRRIPTAGEISRTTKLRKPPVSATLPALFLRQRSLSDGLPSAVINSIDESVACLITLRYSVQFRRERCAISDRTVSEGAARFDQIGPRICADANKSGPTCGRSTEWQSSTRFCSLAKAAFRPLGYTRICDTRRHPSFPR